jgi:hypothetical protein
MNWLRKVGRA